MKTIDWPRISIILVSLIFLNIIISCNKENQDPDDGYTGTRTVGLFVNNSAKVYNGYTLFAPKQNTMT